MRRRLMRFAQIGILIGCFAATVQAEEKLLPFQGYLTNAEGKSIPDGSRIVQFKIYDAPVGGTATWAGEVHRLTINNGLVNTILGTKTSLEETDFSRTLYLEMTIDSNDDNQITVGDPPLLPRQIVLPAAFAREAQDSRLLNGHDWSSVFESSDPNTSKIPGARINPMGLLISSSQLATDSVQSEHIQEGAISAKHLSKETPIIDTANLKPGSVTTEKLSPLNYSASPMLRGFVTSSQSYVLVQADGNAFRASIQTSGRPVIVRLEGGIDVTGSAAEYRPLVQLDIRRKSSGGDFESVGEQGARLGLPGNSSSKAFSIPLSSWSIFDEPPQGQHEYEVWVSSGNAGGDSATISISGRLVVYEL